MNSKLSKLLALLLAVVMVLGVFAGCGKSEEPAVEPDDEEVEVDEETEEEAEEEPAEEEEEELPIAELKSLANKEYGVDYTALYKQFGDDVTIADVIEDEDTGVAYIERDGMLYTLGLDFLTRAMVYNTQVPEGGEWETENDVYADWWRLYITRWNMLLPEIPLYSNEYYDIYNAQIKGVEEFPTNPFWGPTLAMIDWTSEKEDGSIIFGNATELSGKFRNSNFGSNNPGASDQDIQRLITGLETISQTPDGNYVWNDTVVAEHTEVENEDGTYTITVKLADDLVFSDGSPISAKNYVLYGMLFSTPVAAQAAGKDHTAGMQMVGFEDFNVYTGPNSAEGTKEFAGLRLIDDLTFSMTFKEEYYPYFYAIIYGSADPQYLPMWIGEGDILDDGNGCYFTDDVYAGSEQTVKDEEGTETTAMVYDLKDQIYAAAWNHDDTYPTSGMYMFTADSWNEADLSVVLVKNPNFKGTYDGKVPAIEKVVYKKVVSQTQLEDLKSGGVDVISGITGGDETNEAIALADAEAGKFVYTHYSRAGYGKMGFRADFGPVQFTAVRQAITYCMDRAKFAKDFTGGYGGVVDGPYYSGSWMYKEALADGMMLDAYATSVDSAIAVLEEDGWVYNADGSDYIDGNVRYKKIPAAEMDERDITFQSKDGAYKTEKVGDDYYMPLVLNWYGTEDNPFTDLLMTDFLENPLMKQAGFYVQNTIGQFSPMLDELYQAPVYGFYNGTPMYTCFNFATGYNSAVYDYALNMTIDPAEYDNYSIFYIKDQADAYWLQ